MIYSGLIDRFIIELNELISVKQKLAKNAIEIYNNFRPHLSNHMLAPNEMHQQNKIKRNKQKTLRNQRVFLCYRFFNSIFNPLVRNHVNS